MDIITAINSMKNKTISNVELSYTEGEGETLTIHFSDNTNVEFYADDFRTEK